MGVNEHQELDWRYLSTTDAYSSEYSSQGEYDDEDEYLQDDVVIPPIPHPPPQGLRTRPLLVPSRSNSGAFPSGSSPSQALSSSHVSNGAAEADDSTDTIKSMRARALDKINGRGASTSTTTSRTTANELAKSPPRGTFSTGPGKTNSNSINSTKRSTTTSSGTSCSTRPSILSTAHQEERASGQSAKLKRRSFGLERSTLPRITTKFDQDTQTIVRKRNSGSFKSQQVLLTSEDESPGNGYHGARFPTESGGLLLSELKALKARVQELETERMNRSSFSVQSPQLTPQRGPEEPKTLHSEKLQNILQKHRGSTGASPLRSPVTTVARDGSIRAGTLSRLQSPSTPKSSPTTQHVALLQEAFKAFEKTMSSTGPGSVQAMSNVVQNAINVNQTIRTLIKADISLVDSSSMTSLQRASDDQIRSLTEALLGMATQAPFDRTMTPSEAVANGPRPYSPRLSMHTRFDQGQRLSLGMVGQELGAPEPYSSRPYSSAAESVSSTPNMISSGYPSRTNSIASTISNDNRRSTVRHGYSSDYAENRQNGHGTLGRYPIEPVSREPSPPPHDSHGPGQGRLPLPGHLQSPRFATSTPRSAQSPRFASPGLDNVGDSDSAASAQARRQASVRNILARYSQMSPTGPRRDDFESVSQEHGQDHLEHPPRHPLQPRQSNPRLSESVIISPGGTLGRSSVRPLSQQDNRMRSSMSIQGQLGQGRGSIRNTRPNVFSEDEGGWGTVSVGQLDPRSRPAYVHARHQQEDDQGYPVGYLERSFQAHAHKGFSDGEAPMTRQQMMRQRHQQQDMAMTTPSMSSPTSSPSSSSRLEGQSLASSGYGGADGRYHLSPRGPAHPSTFPRQQSLIGMSNLLEYGSHSGTIGRAMAKTVASLGEHAFHQQHHALDGLSPQAQAQFGHILAQD
ncbi:hypothetical protein BGZ81_011091 [Podila clonocystis]|nr:hypothetical protein BGZ81_011091 [Podila clonocystis]